MRCDKCVSKYRCKSSYKNKYSSNFLCKKHREYKIKDNRNLFNSKKYYRNPRERGYMLLKRTIDGTIYALADVNVTSMGWHSNVGILWRNHMDAEFYQKETKTWSSYDPTDEIFVVRIKSKRCPIEINFEAKAPRCNRGNVLFKPKDNIKLYYDSVIHSPV